MQSRLSFCRIFSYVHVNGAVANDHFLAPHLVKYFVSQKTRPGFDASRYSNSNSFFSENDIVTIYCKP